MKNIKILVILVLTLLFLFWDKNYEIEFFGNREKICGLQNLNRIDIWEKTKNRYGEKVSLDIFPKTYLLPNEINDIKKDKNSQFILKKLWAGARKGVDLFDNKSDITKNYKDYDIAQVYIKNPLLINGFKFDIRFFLVTYCGIGNFLYVKGYNVYTEKKFNYQSQDRKRKINQSFGTDEHYNINKLPRTTEQLAKYLNINFDIVLNKLTEKISKIINSCNDLCCKNDRENHNFNIYGLDVELLDNLEPMVIEVNSAPSLRFDVEWKSKLISGLFEDLKKETFNNKNWIKIN